MVFNIFLQAYILFLYLNFKYREDGDQNLTQWLLTGCSLNENLLFFQYLNT